MITISPITSEQTQKLIDNIKSHGSSVDLRSGQYVITGHGITAMAKIEGSILTVTVQRKPFYVSLKMIEDGLNSAIAL